MKTNQLKKYQKLYKVLNNQASFDATFDEGLPLTGEVINYQFSESLANKGLDIQAFKLPEAYVNFCELHDGFAVKWHYNPKPQIMGFVNFSRSFAAATNSIEMNGKQLFLFDDFLDKWKVYMELSKDPAKYSLHYVNFYENKCYPMVIRIEQYFEKAAMCRGLTNWHEFFFEDRNYESDEGNRVRFLQELKMAFPDTASDIFTAIE